MNVYPWQPMKSKRPGYKRTAYEYTLNTPNPKAKIIKSKIDQVARANHDVLMDSQNLSDNIDQSIHFPVRKSTRLQICDSPSGHQPLTSTTIKPCHRRVSLRLAESVKDISTHSPAMSLKQKFGNENIDRSSFVQSGTTKHNEPNTVQHSDSEPLSKSAPTQLNECLVLEQNSVSTKTATTRKSTGKKSKRMTPQFTTKKPSVDGPISKCSATIDTTVPNVPVCDNVQSATLAKTTKLKKDEITGLSRTNHDDELMDSQNISDNIDQSIHFPESTRFQVCDSPSGHQPLTSTTIKPCHRRVSLRLAESVKDISTHSPAKRLKQKVDNENIDRSSFVQSDTIKHKEPNTVQHSDSEPLSKRAPTQLNECLVLEQNSVSKTATTRKSTGKKVKRITPRFTTKRNPPVDLPISKCIKNTTIHNIPICDNVQSTTPNVVQVAPGLAIPPLSDDATDVTLESTENSHMEPIAQNSSETEMSDMNTLLKKRRKRSVTRKTTNSRSSKRTACIDSPSIINDDTITVVQHAVCNNVERIKPTNMLKSSTVKEKSVIQQESTDLPASLSMNNGITTVEYDLCSVTQKSSVCKKEKSTVAKKKRKRITPRFLTSKKTTSPRIVSPTEKLLISPTEGITQSVNQLELSDGNIYTGQQEKEQEEPNNNPASGIENYDPSNNNNDHDDQSIQSSPARIKQRKEVSNPPDESLQPSPAKRKQRKEVSNPPVESLQPSPAKRKQRKEVSNPPVESFQPSPAKRKQRKEVSNPPVESLQPSPAKRKQRKEVSNPPDESIQPSPAKRKQRKEVSNPPVESLQPSPAKRKQRKEVSNPPVERVTYDLWHPIHIIRNHTMFNELDVCLSIYSNAITNAIERETDVGVKNTLIKHRRLTRKRMMRAIMEVYVLDRIKERVE